MVASSRDWRFLRYELEIGQEIVQDSTRDCDTETGVGRKGRFVTCELQVSRPYHYVAANCNACMTAPVNVKSHVWCKLVMRSVSHLHKETQALKIFS